MGTIDKKTVVIAAATLVVGLLIGWFIFGGQKNTPKDEHQHTTQIAGETIWTCSMHPQIRKNEPGDCPICGMDLIPLENDQNSEIDPMAIAMSPTAMQLANVSTALVGKMKPVKQVRLNGKVQVDERLVYSQSSHIPGRVEKLMVNFTGEFVNKGQTIASVYSPELVMAQEELFEAQKIMETQPQLFNAAKEKLKNWKLSDNKIEGILKNGKILEEFPIQADVSGYVTKKIINLGDYVRKGQTLYEIANLSKVWVLFDVYESDISWIKKGDNITFTISSLPGESFEASITYLDPVIDPKTRVAKARIEYNNTTEKLKPEMFVSGVVEAKLTNKSNSLVVPKTAVMWTGKRSVVYVKNTNAKGVSFIMRDVTLGAALGDSYIIKEGLEEGEEIAVNGTFSIDAAAQLAGKPSMMNPEGGVAMTGHNHGETKMEDTKTPAMQKDVKTNNPISISKEAKKALQPVYADYLKLKDFLTADSVEDAKKVAVSMQDNLAKINMSIFTGESHTVWMKFSSNLKNTLQHIPHLLSIEEVREKFRQISIIMIEMTNTFNPFDKTLYIQYCPMADNDKGADWLSSEKEIKNPYFGKSMLKCGEVTKEIK
ncbi:MAG: efflux RND transporter periplasmic adaptor subunit [Flavobacteriales bacterium]|nr:efflux RND transporter periplasmic adaptor subunit [Flavobacteriales bacterium]MCW8911754.1 efflux RND transporter periplasmic adaptor subunit [Flavobacteriales bacterium]MCW8937013.1 efflux RND transporter periplasmic adaptor subunit [Flavobacteriales bacterium]MCW8968450.1 efflux RND transporter periplasmic adaptor subunit [Flavobacteriales bacterium]MCW8989781.1 efflux RND transporter periplasmic adaptor subunit [Flavobacteriales bacterium]